jgi:hypothetical protein
MHSTAANSILKGRPSFLEAVHGLCGLWSLLEATPSSVFSFAGAERAPPMVFFAGDWC